MPLLLPYKLQRGEPPSSHSSRYTPRGAQRSQIAFVRLRPCEAFTTHRHEALTFTCLIRHSRVRTVETALHVHRTTPIVNETHALNLKWDILDMVCVGYPMCDYNGTVSAKLARHTKSMFGSFPTIMTTSPRMILQRLLDSFSLLYAHKHVRPSMPSCFVTSS